MGLCTHADQSHRRWGGGADSCSAIPTTRTLHTTKVHLTDKRIMYTFRIAIAHMNFMDAKISSPLAPFSSPECVLLRFLSLVSTHDWESEPLIVNLNNELSGQGFTLVITFVVITYMHCIFFIAAEMADIHSRFTSQRSQLPPCYIATPLHRDSSPLTSPSPTLPVLCRTCLLAQESLSLLSHQLTSSDLATIDIKVEQNWYTCLIHVT